jgi:hypothetical protein
MVDVDGQHDELDDDRFVTRAPPVMPRVSDADRTGKSTRAVYEHHGFPGRHIGASGWRPVDANNSINR